VAQKASDINSYTSVLDKKHLDTVASVLAGIANGTYDFQYGTKKELNGGLSVVFIEGEKSFAYDGVLEAHKKYCDLHCTMQGTDIIELKPVESCTAIKKEYDAEGDYVLFNERGDEKILLEEGWMCLLKPTDAHMALLGDGGLVKKLVFKIPVKQ
jgi:YhcH/YjgK/YiaL family protein